MSADLLALMEMPGPDPFADTPDATASDCVIRKPWKSRPQKTVELLGNSGAKPKKADFNPKQREWFERNGYTFERVERANTFGSVTVDMHGFADYIAFKAGEILLVQTTSKHNMSARETKARSKPELSKWLEAGGRFAIHGWHQPKGPGTRWEVDIREVTEAGPRAKGARR